MYTYTHTYLYIYEGRAPAVTLLIANALHLPQVIYFFASHSLLYRVVILAEDKGGPTPGLHNKIPA